MYTHTRFLYHHELKLQREYFAPFVFRLSYGKSCWWHQGWQYKLSH